MHLNTNLEGDNVYVAIFRHAAESGSIRAYLQGQMIGEVSGIGALHSHSNGIGLGGAKGKTLYHDGETRKKFFKGYISEYIHYTSSLSEELFQDLVNYLQEKYISSELHVVNISASDTEIAEKSSKDISDETTITISISEPQAEDLNIEFSLTGSAVEGIDYDSLSQYSVTIPASSTSAQFTLKTINDNIAEISEKINIVLKDPNLPGIGIGTFSASINIVDDDAYSPPGEISFWYRGDIGLELDASNRIMTWNDQSGASIHANQTENNLRPFANGLINGIPAVLFQGGEFLAIPSDKDIDKDKSYSKKTIAFSFKTGNSIAGNQIIFEQGDDIQGINIHISQNNLYFNIWNFEGKGKDKPFQSVYLSQSISPDTIYTGVFTFDAGDHEISLYLNSSQVMTQSGVNKLQKHTGGNAIGGINGQTVLFDNTILSGPAYFKGYLGEMLYFDDLLSGNEQTELLDYLLQKYQP